MNKPTTKKAKTPTKPRVGVQFQKGLAVESWPIAKLKPYKGNPRKIPQSAVEKVAASIERFGWQLPIRATADGVLVAGHTRLLAAKLLELHEVPVSVFTGTKAEARAYRIADNRVAAESAFDDETLAAELRALIEEDFPLEATGFDDDEIAKLLGTENQPTGDPDAVPPVPSRPITKLGDVWKLGEHRVMCGDSTKPEDMATLTDGAVINLLHADPPYGMGKQCDGVANDNLYAEKLDEFQLAWWKASRPFLAANASCYIWGNAPDLWRLWYSAGLGAIEPLTLRNEIVWDKQSVPGMASPDLMQDPEATERCLFFQLGRHVLLINQTQADYWEGWEPIRTYLCQQRDLMGWQAAEVKKLTGNQMYGHWFGKSQWGMISRGNYEKLKAAAAGKAFARDYDDLQKQYREILADFNGEVRGPRREEHNAVRPYFDNAHEIMRDVWDFPRVTGDDRHGHATPKPAAMMERVIRSSARPGELVLEPFGGSGSTVIGAEMAGATCYAMELQPEYCDVIVRRWQQFTGRAAVLEATGKGFPKHHAA